MPITYTSAADQLALGTLWVGYIPTPQVDALAAQIKAKQSKFYTAVPIEAARQLAARVLSGWGITGTISGSAGSGSSSSGGAGGAGGGVGSGTGAIGGAGSGSTDVRRDAIIGVVSSLGAIALVVFAVLGVQYLKRRREMGRQHTRLADAASSSASLGSGAGGRGGRDGGVVVGEREFDRDSVGAPRRRSFYFAEDSLRGWEVERGEAVLAGGGGGGVADEFGIQQVSGLKRQQQQQQGMSQRKVGPVVVPGLISAPILRESSMNW